MNSFYILRFDRDAYNALNAEVEEGEEVADDGLEEAFEAVAEVSEGGKSKIISTATVKWVTDCFIYITLSLENPRLTPKSSTL